MGLAFNSSTVEFSGTDLSVPIGGQVLTGGLKIDVTKTSAATSLVVSGGVAVATPTGPTANASNAAATTVSGGLSLGGGLVTVGSLGGTLTLTESGGTTMYASNPHRHAGDPRRVGLVRRPGLRVGRQRHRWRAADRVGVHEHLGRAGL